MKPLASRNYCIDYLRAICMLYIVCYWHLIEYLNIDGLTPEPYGRFIAHSVLAVFFAISGYLNARPDNVQFLPFFVRKIVRIYPLYVFFLFIFFILRLNDGVTTVKAAVFLTPLIGGNPVTLWFVAQLFLFLLITPALIKYLHSKSAPLVLISSFFVGAYWVSTFDTVIDKRVLLFFPAYLSGLAFRLGSMTSYAKLSIFMLILFSIFGVLTKNTGFLLLIGEAIAVCLISVLMLYICIFKLHVASPHKSILKLSFISFTAYLVHRPVYECLSRIISPWVDSGLSWIVFLSVGIPIVWYAAYFIQRYYDQLMSLIWEKSRRKI